MSLTSRIAEAKRLFPGDDLIVARLFGAALHYEEVGEQDKANEYLEKALVAEATAASTA